MRQNLVVTQVLNGIVYLVSLMGNRGTFTKSLRGIVTDLEFIYHMGYLVVSMMGMCVHEFSYSLLVSVFRIILYFLKLLQLISKFLDTMLVNQIDLHH